MASHSVRRLRFFTSSALAAAAFVSLTGCKPATSPTDSTKEPTQAEAEITPIPPAEEQPSATPAPEATPTPTPRPINIPRKEISTARLFRGASVVTQFETTPGTTATKDRDIPGSYEVNVTVRLTVPQPHRSLEELSSLNAHLPTLLPGLPTLLETGKVAPSYEKLYQLKLDRMERNLERLDLLLPRHDLFDCETILHLQDPTTQRKMVLIQTDMDVDTDGSDGDRLPNPDGKDTYFQPMTSYKWPKRTENPNPFLPASEARLQKAKDQLAEVQKKKGATKEEMQEARNRVGSALYEVTQLKKSSFLISATDPYIVIPGFMLREKNAGYTPKIGDYAAVIYNDVIYPAILGDAGPSHKAGEASVRLCKHLNPRSTPYSRPVSNLKVTYLVFPGTAEKEAEFPDLNKWHAKLGELLNEVGGFAEGKLYAWETTWEPLPTPTPTPEPTPEATPEASPGAAPDVTPASPEAQPSPAASPEAMQGGTPEPSPTPVAPSPPAATPAPVAP